MKKHFLIAICALLLVSCGGRNESAPANPKVAANALKHYPIVDSLLRVMTLDEKIGQLVLYTSDWDVTGPSIRSGYVDDIRSGKCGNIFNAYTAAYTRQLQEIAVNETRLGIPLLFGYDVIHGFRTIFPINLGISASWDMPLIQESARIAAREAAAAGLHWTYSPMCDICVEPRWGRISEGAGEDAFLGSEVARAMVYGYQGGDLEDPLTIAACVKHFAAYGAPHAGRDYNTVDMSERWLREFYLPPYKAAVDAGAQTAMASFNEYDGTPATANRHLLTEILRDEWGFDGFVVSDYTGVMEMINHGTSRDLEDASIQALNAGNDMDMQSGGYSEFLAKAMKEGKVSKKTLDEAVRRVLTVKARLGLFEDPYRYCSPEREAAETKTEANLLAARTLAEESCVLLKNTHNLLPLDKNSTVAVIGPLADSADDLLASWRGAGQVEGIKSLLEGIREMAGGVVYAKGCDIENPGQAGFNQAEYAARSASTVIMVLGESCDWTGEAACRTSIQLPEVQKELLRRIAATGQPIVLVLLNGRPLDLSEESELADAILEAWYPGTMGGEAVARLLFGEASPSGRLSVTFPYNLGQVPIYHYAKNTGRPYVHKGVKYESRYLDCENEPLYPFGYGLTYTTFSYSKPELSAAEFGPMGSITAKATITNTGAKEGTEVVQLYIRDMVGSVTRPVKQLKGFERVTLAPGESRTVEFEITPELISFWRKDMTFGPEAGEFRAFIGPASDCTEFATFTYNE
ncbi:MAG: beta-glucosidase BglX [Bacteroidales bacterium]|nr:beta-glucosidase BglX [Bacteroidales bacterium]